MTGPYAERPACQPVPLQERRIQGFGTVGRGPGSSRPYFDPTLRASPDSSWELLCHSVPCDGEVTQRNCRSAVFRPACQLSQKEAGAPTPRTLPSDGPTTAPARRAFAWATPPPMRERRIQALLAPYSTNVVVSRSGRKAKNGLCYSAVFLRVPAAALLAAGSMMSCKHSLPSHDYSTPYSSLVQSFRDPVCQLLDGCPLRQSLGRRTYLCPLRCLPPGAASGGNSARARMALNSQIHRQAPLLNYGLFHVIVLWDP